jgi:YD repeat-containing protein
MSALRRLGTILLFAIAGPCLADGADEPIPSFYQEPGISRTREYTNQHPTERVDPFTGKLQLHHVDLFIPGNGGMDIKVQRSYNSLSGFMPEPSPAGMGWTMHFGRVLRKASVALCATNTGPTVNPVLELPDGSRRVLYVALDNASFVSTDFWIADCTSNPGALTVFSPDGTRYEMSRGGTAVGSGTNVQNTYYVSRITDRNGNWMTVSYVDGSTTAVSGLATSDGREVTFNYTAMNGLTHVLGSVTDGGPTVSPTRTWTYVQVPAPGASGATNLAEVRRPDGQSWKYDYHDTDSGGVGAQYSLKRVTYPGGGTIDYTYGAVRFSFNLAIPQSTVVTQKVANPGGTWTWAYTPASQTVQPDENGSIDFDIPPSAGQAAQLDRTLVVGPQESRTYYHLGYNSATAGFVYLVGSLFGVASAVQSEGYSHSPMKISNQPNQRPGDALTSDAETAVPLVKRHTIARSDETFATAYAEFDAYGNPGTIAETGSATRTTRVTYFVNTAKWIIRQRRNETITSGAETYAITRSFDPSGNLLSESRSGVSTGFTYTPEGDVATRTDARGKTTTYTDYFRGIARSESQPEGVAISRTVSPAGNVTSETDAEDATTAFGYDGLGRITSITHARGSPVTVEWGANTRKVTRGAYQELATYDGFGRQVQLKHTDTASGQVIMQDYRIDSLGRRTFASYPNATAGTRHLFDMLNRPTFVLNGYDPGSDQATSWKRYTHAAYKTAVTDERNNTHVHRYRVFGDPDRRELLGIADPPDGNAENTLIARNIAGQITQVSRAGVTRAYGYDSRFHMVSITEPEAGVTTMGRDAAGNMTSRRVGSAGQVTYTYDDRGRLAAVNYPAGTPSVVRTYYKDDKLKSVDNGVAARGYTYDGNKNLLAETLTTVSSGTRTFTVQYGYDGNDALSTLTYGSGRVVDYAPDAFGRATRAGAYVTAVSYHPTGQPSSITYGNGVQTTVGLNGRTWPSSMRIVRGTDLFNGTFGYDEAGNLLSIADTVDPTYDRGMGYDEFDRLTTVNGPWGAGAIAYDLRSNITRQTLGSFDLNYTYDGATHRLASVSGSKAYAMGYDTYGNVTANGAMMFSYDDAMTMRCARCGQADEIRFDYDGAGQRVRLQKSGTETYFVHGHGGQLLWEETPGGLLKEYVYLQGKAVATKEQKLP